MSTTSTTSALRSLLPSHPIPPLLTSTSESLLALSRSRARNLKPEEEIARAHACAEIACFRLRAQLRLPAIKSGAGAPCQPRVYAKLVKFLDGVLGDAKPAAGATGTLRGKKRDGDGNVLEKETRGVTTPGKKQSGPTTPRKNPETGFVGVVKNTRKSKGDSDSDDKAPAFAMPSIRTLCRALSTPTLAPHIYTGTCILLPLSKTWTPDTEMTSQLRGDILALITALYLMVLTRMQTEEMTTEVYDDVTARAVRVLEMDGTADTDTDTDVGGEGGAMLKIEEWIGTLNEQGWCDGMDWWGSVPESVLDVEMLGTVEQDGEDEAVPKEQQTEEVKLRVDVDEEDPKGVLLPGLGTMLHDGVDWTSADRCLDYREWMEGIMRTVATPAKAAGIGRNVAVK